MVAEFIISLSVSAIVCAVVGIFLIPYLRKVKAGQSIREDGPVWHKSKQGTPTMGGLMFITGIIAVTFTVGLSDIISGNLAGVFILVFALIFALVGFLDDYEKLKKKQNLGLRAKHKFALQLIVAIIFILIMEHTDYISFALYIPFVNTYIHVHPVLYYVFASFVIVGTVNSVNLTDGTDGLSSGVTIPVSAFFTIVAFVWGEVAIGIVAAAVTGGLIAFLFFNFHPAKVFMGDTGSMFLGGIICALAFALDMPMILVTIGFVYFIEALSVIIQVSHFKLTKGKRVFKMAPIHHHFEMCGWNEYKVFAVFTTVSVIFAVISYFGVYHRI
ncbi:MAG: phospho-N-acetylmuramoyl-pentapeptide-transferase [Oscillospiraceae bacterium]|nr:phospho-N-acetylmuramoyl-pentapeptide-transferase [Oscillospiraceae bacterium]MCL2278084.1 phospho-N-acetylmuramoyl-pentapeptide-transferase [Oscillospiraceae bacterium]